MCALVGVKCFGVAIDRLCNGQITPESGQQDANAKNYMQMQKGLADGGYVGCV